ncbi:hypothetical protein M758_4G141600 [Ceratodon purpureus]|nr:hypothetical protein M758_4G141600 [Ceratodon purpureus]
MESANTIGAMIAPLWVTLGCGALANVHQHRCQVASRHEAEWPCTSWLTPRVSRCCRRVATSLGNLRRRPKLGEFHGRGCLSRPVYP